MLKKKLIKIQFVNAKTQFENAKTQKTAQVVAWTCLDRRTKKSPAMIISKSLGAKNAASSAKVTPFRRLSSSSVDAGKGRLMQTLIQF